MMSYKNKSGIRQCGSLLLCSILCVVFLAAPVRVADLDEDIDAAVQFYLSREDSHFCKDATEKLFLHTIYSSAKYINILYLVLLCAK